MKEHYEVDEFSFGVRSTSGSDDRSYGSLIREMEADLADMRYRPKGHRPKKTQLYVSKEVHDGRYLEGVTYCIFENSHTYQGNNSIDELAESIVRNFNKLKESGTTSLAISNEVMKLRDDYEMDHLAMGQMRQKLNKDEFKNLKSMLKTSGIKIYYRK